MTFTTSSDSFRTNGSTGVGVGVGLGVGVGDDVGVGVAAFVGVGVGFSVMRSVGPDEGWLPKIGPGGNVIIENKTKY